MYYIFHAICMVYCLWRVFKRYHKTSVDGVIGTYPGLDMLMIVLLAPVLAVVDVVVSWYLVYQEYRNDSSKKVL